MNFPWVAVGGSKVGGSEGGGSEDRYADEIRWDIWLDSCR